MQTYTIDTSTKWLIPSYSHLYAFVQYGGQGTLYRLSVPRSGYLDCRVGLAGLYIGYKDLMLVNRGGMGHHHQPDKATKQQRRRSLQLSSLCSNACPCRRCLNCQASAELTLVKPYVKPSLPNARALMLSHAVYETERGLASETERGLAPDPLPRATVIPRPLFVPSISFLNTTPEIAALQSVFDAMTDLHSPIILIVEPRSQ